MVLHLARRISRIVSDFFHFEIGTIESVLEVLEPVELEGVQIHTKVLLKVKYV